MKTGSMESGSTGRGRNVFKVTVHLLRWLIAGSGRRRSPPPRTRATSSRATTARHSAAEGQPQCRLSHRLSRDSSTRHQRDHHHLLRRSAAQWLSHQRPTSPAPPARTRDLARRSPLFSFSDRLPTRASASSSGHLVVTISATIATRATVHRSSSSPQVAIIARLTTSAIIFITVASPPSTIQQATDHLRLLRPSAEPQRTIASN